MREMRTRGPPCALASSITRQAFEAAVEGGREPRGPCAMRTRSLIECDRSGIQAEASRRTVELGIARTMVQRQITTGMSPAFTWN